MGGVCLEGLQVAGLHKCPGAAVLQAGDAHGAEVGQQIGGRFGVRGLSKPPQPRQHRHGQRRVLGHNCQCDEAVLQGLWQCTLKLTAWLHGRESSEYGNKQLTWGMPRCLQSATDVRMVLPGCREMGAEVSGGNWSRLARFDSWLTRSSAKLDRRECPQLGWLCRLSPLCRGSSMDPAPMHVVQ